MVPVWPMEFLFHDFCGVLKGSSSFCPRTVHDAFVLKQNAVQYLRLSANWGYPSPVVVYVSIDAAFATRASLRALGEREVKNYKSNDSLSWKRLKM